MMFLWYTKKIFIVNIKNSVRLILIHRFGSTPCKKIPHVLLRYTKENILTYP